MGDTEVHGSTPMVNTDATAVVPTEADPVKKLLQFVKENANNPRLLEFVKAQAPEKPQEVYEAIADFYEQETGTDLGDTLQQISEPKLEEAAAIAMTTITTPGGIEKAQANLLLCGLFAPVFMDVMLTILKIEAQREKLDSEMWIEMQHLITETAKELAKLTKDKAALESEKLIREGVAHIVSGSLSIVGSLIASRAKTEAGSRIVTSLAEGSGKVAEGVINIMNSSLVLQIGSKEGAKIILENVQRIIENTMNRLDEDMKKAGESISSAAQLLRDVLSKVKDAISKLTGA